MLINILEDLKREKLKPIIFSPWVFQLQFAGRVIQVVNTLLTDLQVVELLGYQNIAYIVSPGVYGTVKVTESQMQACATELLQSGRADVGMFSLNVDGVGSIVRP